MLGPDESLSGSELSDHVGDTGSGSMNLTVFKYGEAGKWTRLFWMAMVVRRGECMRSDDSVEGSLRAGRSGLRDI